MPIDPEDLYTAAQNLNRMKPPLVSDEVCARTMLNRMYYAAYLATREAIRAQSSDSAFDVTHRALAATLMQAGDWEVQALGTRLRNLKDAREHADYQPHGVVSKLAASLRLDGARFVLGNARRLAGRFPQIRAR